MSRRNHLRVSIAILMTLLLLVSCRAFRRPEQGPASGAPAIPKAIAKGARQEPTLKVYIKDTKQVKTMPFEEYITGVVAAEMDPKWPLEALAAQAILARTFTLEKIAREGGVPNRNAHASTDTEEFQAYDASRINSNVREAVRVTRGKVAAYNGNYILAWFHANSGGKTATAAEGLSFEKVPTPYIVSVDDPISLEAAPAKDRAWTATFSKAEVTQALQKMGQKPGKFTDIKIVEKGNSGRALKLGIGNATVTAPEFRLAMGSTKLKSTLIDSITVSGNNITFKGKGYGHGVGMSQWGAKGRSEQGAKAEDIIKTYFRGINIYKIWD